MHFLFKFNNMIIWEQKRKTVLKAWYVTPILLGRRNRLEPRIIWQEYVDEKQTYGQLATTYGCLRRTNKRKIDLYKASLPT